MNDLTISDLQRISLDAHIRYMYSKIVDTDEQQGFLDALEKKPPSSKSKQYKAGYAFYCNMVKEINENLSDRFDGWSKDYMDGFERL